MPAQSDLVVVVMGPCGVGKSAVAERVADQVGGAFIEADDLHSSDAKARMARGDALTDDLRAPWLDRVAEASRTADRPTLVACSALKRAYRDRLRNRLNEVFFVHLSAPRDLIASRLTARRNHFVGIDLLDSQLAILEPLGPDEAGITIDVAAPLRTVCERVIDVMAAHQAADSRQVETRLVPDLTQQTMQGR